MRQSTFVFHHASHPWSNNRFLIWMVNLHAFTLNSILFNIFMSPVENILDTDVLSLVQNCRNQKSIVKRKNKDNYLFLHKIQNICSLLQLCFLRQFRGSIRKSDYFALRLGFLTVSICFLAHFSLFTPNKRHYFMIIVLNPFFITLKLQKHNLPFTYNFHMYMVRSMEDEFHGIVGIRYAFP